MSAFKNVFKNEGRKKMKESNKESIKKETKEENKELLVCADENSEKRSPKLYINWPSFIRFFNETLHKEGSSIEPLRYLSKGKKSRVQALVNRWNTKQALVDAVVKMAKSDLLNGRCKGRLKWKASFIWLTESDDHFEKVLNGYYDNPPVQELTPEEQHQLELERYKAREAERRAEARRIEEEESAKRAAAREYAARHCVSYEEYQRMKKNGELD